ncbi:MAG: phosphoenolpyruvate--protein phosphotransferase [Propionivibrio sp.]|uniref:Phosphoenolpyruvate-protein phosphotransferase n=1 Tax=Candidatus Propionivibrio dominans TaxID=2954373 RepID=A0A9D7FIH0_9RHOO|nr:phosphoenolpyruvate--protein phosphotransferase [Candidatus Propionivibrio dominans]MBL0167244.1 phosphoenolpyruvate--protein phosphotransferase [Propionivibrio sp.]
MSFTLHGLAVSSGIAIGQAHLISQATLEVSHLVIAQRMVEKEVARFETALARVRNEFGVIRNGLGKAPTDIGAFIDLHLLILSDPELSEVPKHIIRERRCNAEWAIVQQMELLVAQFEKIEDTYLRERSYDVRQVVERVVRELVGRPGHATAKAAKGVKGENLIVVAHDLSPSDVMAFKDQNFASFVTDVGGSTSHTAILARGMAIPAVLGLHNARQLIRDKETLIVDGTRGVVIVNPDARILEEYELKKCQIEIERSKLKLLKTTRSTTLDRVKIDLLANIEEPSDVTVALESGAEGVGLFRTEFIFLGRGDMPSEDEQFEAYRKVVKGMQGRPVTIRTFDLGNDKNIHSDDAIGERKRDNPALGLRSIRLSLAEPKTFQSQLRAILRVSKLGKVKILIPMLSHAHQIDQTLAALEQAKSSLRGEKISFDENIEIGGMIEVPAAALAVGIFLRRMNFLSIGTNDLIQYTLAIDRSDEQVSYLYDPLHPAVLMLLAHVISTAEKVNIPVSMCGELAGDPKLTRLLLGMGLRQFSMHPAQIPAVKQKVKQSDISEVIPIVRRILRLEESAKIQEQIERLNA